MNIKESGRAKILERVELTKSKVPQKRNRVGCRSRGRAAFSRTLQSKT